MDAKECNKLSAIQLMSKTATANLTSSQTHEALPSEFFRGESTKNTASRIDSTKLRVALAAQTPNTSATSRRPSGEVNALNTRGAVV
mmetsp:Transcript_4787/g.15986  ORF Transcript_4787/g.15986 Transcript_4787/m.15986 type:complete len:87 (+) Transcript_4787:159-419(+)